MRLIIGAMAAACCSTCSRVNPAARNRTAHGNDRCQFDTGSRNGLRSLPSIQGKRFHSPGVEYGINAVVLMDPALPNDVAVPATRGSNKVTRCPSSKSFKAVHKPTMPAPITLTWYCALVGFKITFRS